QQSGRLYYWNSATEQSQWERPVIVVSSPPPGVPPSLNMAGGPVEPKSSTATAVPVPGLTIIKPSSSSSSSTRTQQQPQNQEPGDGAATPGAAVSSPAKRSFAPSSKEEAASIKEQEENQEKILSLHRSYPAPPAAPPVSEKTRKSLASFGLADWQMAFAEILMMNKDSGVDKRVLAGKKRVQKYLHDNYQSHGDKMTKCREADPEQYVIVALRHSLLMYKNICGSRTNQFGYRTELRMSEEERQRQKQ
ncbi:unnamed protein product, partial [Amoebophrya sp. A25]